MGFSQIYECVIKSMDRARTATCFSAAALAANILLNAILIFGLLGFPALGMAGAAIATVIARGIEMALCVADAAGQKDIHVGPAVLLIWNKVLFKDFRRYSMPALGNEFLWGAGFSCYTIVLGHMGSDIVAANSVVSAARNLCTVFVFGAAYGTAIIVGNDIGKGSEETARKDAAAMLRVVFWAALLSGLILVLLRPLILHFTTLSSTAEYDLGIMLWINCIYILGMAMNTVYICGIFRAGGDSRYGFILDTIAMWCIFVPLGFISAFLLHLPALVVYTIICSDEFFKLPVNIRHYRKGTWIRNITRSEAELK
jgi:Na+-driven multidrug efflux pump